MDTTTASKIESARLAYVALCEGIGSDSVTEETAILSAGREFLPPCAVAVLDDRDAASVEYYAFLTEETERAQAEHEREVSAGHEWHTDARGGRTAREVQAFRDGYAEGFRCASSGLDDEPIDPAGMRDVSSLDSDGVRAIKLAAVAADGAGQTAGRIDGAKRRAGDPDFNGEGSFARAEAAAETAWLATA